VATPFTGDGAYDRADVTAAVHQRHPEAAIGVYALNRMLDPGHPESIRVR